MADDIKGHANMESVMLKSGTEISVGGTPAWLSNDTTVRSEQQNIEKLLRNAQPQESRQDQEKTGSRR